MRFWDTSAIVPLLIEEPHSPHARDLIDADEQMAVWWGTALECESAFARMRREGVLTMGDENTLSRTLEELRLRWIEVSPTEEIRTIARRLVKTHRLRAADALQLAAAIVCNAQLDVEEFVSFDVLLREAAQLEGLLLV